MSLCLRGRLHPILWSFDSICDGVATHGLRAVCGASAQFVMVSNHGISVPFVIHVLVGFMLLFVIGLPPFVISGFLEMISRICASPIFVISIDKPYRYLCIGEFVRH